MKRFVFKDITISEAHRQFFDSFDELHELKNGKLVKIVRIGILQQISFSETDLQAFSSANPFMDNGEMDISKIQKSGPLHFGFLVTVTTPPNKRGISTQWEEWITVPYKLMNERTSVSTDYPESLIN